MPEQMTSNQFLELVNRTNKDNPQPADVQELRLALETNPELLRLVGNLAQQSRSMLVQSTKMSAAAKEIMIVGIEKLNNDLGYIDAPVLEKLLIEQVVICYLRLYLWEYTYHAKNGSLSKKEGQEWETLISSAQRRYLRAIETLARIRKLGINIQVNVATNGGQQVNIN